MANQNLSNAKTAKNDEFYTQYHDIEVEVNAYLEYSPDVFRGKTVLLPCDDPEWSNFTKFFAQKFQTLGLKKLISTSYAPDSKRYKFGYQPSLFETAAPPQYDAYSLLIFPFRSNTFEMTGNGFLNGFVSRYDATADTLLTKSRRDLFTHEIGHKWLNNGTVWFAEGFNEMQTAYQLVASGLDSPEYFADYFNKALSGLQHNPYRNVPGQQAEDHFWDDNDYTWLLYWRGFCYAFHLAGLYEKQTGRANAWKPMMQAFKPFLHDFSGEKLVNALATTMDRERLEQDYRKYIIEGKDFDFKPEDLPSGCTIGRKQDGVPMLEVTDSAAFAKHFQ